MTQPTNTSKHLDQPPSGVTPADQVAIAVWRYNAERLRAAGELPTDALVLAGADLFVELLGAPETDRHNRWSFTGPRRDLVCLGAVVEAATWMSAWSWVIVVGTGHAGTVADERRGRDTE